MLPLSDQLVTLLNMKSALTSQTPISLSQVGKSLRHMVPEEATEFPVLAESLAPMKLLACLKKISVCDSAVRDMVTCGHLAKLLARKDILDTTGNYNLVALPNRYFDLLSLSERQAYFDSGRTLHDISSATERKQAMRIMAREARRRRG